MRSTHNGRRRKFHVDTPSELGQLIAGFLSDMQDEVREATKAALAIEDLQEEMASVKKLIRKSKSNTALLERVERLETRMSDFDRWSSRLGRRKKEE